MSATRDRVLPADAGSDISMSDGVLLTGATGFVGMTTVRDLACFGIYADRETLLHADGLARDIDKALVELLAGTHRPRARLALPGCSA